MQKCAELARRGLQHAAGNPTVMAHCGLALLQSAKEYDLGMAALAIRGGGQPQQPGGRHPGGHRAPSLRQHRGRPRLFPPGAAAEPPRSVRAMFRSPESRTRRWSRRLPGGARLGAPLAGAQPDLRPHPLDADRRQCPSRPHGRGAPVPRRAQEARPWRHCCAASGPDRPQRTRPGLPPFSTVCGSPGLEEG